MARNVAVYDDQGRLLRGRFTGPAFPFGASEAGTLGPKSDLEVALTSMVNILSTPKRSVPYDQTIGSEVPLLLWEPLDEVTLGLLRYYAGKDLSDQEPRIVVHAAYAQRIWDNKVRVTPVFSLVGDAQSQVHNAPLTFMRVSGEGA
jgi:phage baseplate assembly protein W